MRVLAAIAATALFLAGGYGLVTALTTDNREVPPGVVMTHQSPWQR